MTGIGVYPPTIVLSTDSMGVYMDPDENTTRTFQLSNTGSSPLYWDGGFGQNDSRVVADRSRIGFHATKPEEDLNRRRGRQDLAENNQNSGRSNGRNSGSRDFVDEFQIPSECITGTAWVQEELYFINYCDSTLNRYDVETDEMYTVMNASGGYDADDTLRVGWYPYGMTYDGGLLWIGNDQGTVNGYYLEDLGQDGFGSDSTVAYWAGSFNSPEWNYQAIAWDGSAFVMRSAFNYNANFHRVDYDGTILEVLEAPADSVMTPGLHFDPAVGLLGNSGQATIYRFDRNGDNVLVTDSTVTGLDDYNWYYDNLASTTEHLFLTSWNGYTGVLDRSFGGMMFSLDPASGTVEPGGSMDVTVTYNSPIEKGEYGRMLTLYSNDVNNPMAGITQVMRVVGTPGVTLADDYESDGNMWDTAGNIVHVDMDSLPFLASDNQPLHFMNYDSNTVSISLSLADGQNNGMYSLGGTELSLAPYASGVLEVFIDAPVEEMNAYTDVIVTTSHTGMESHLVAFSTDIIPANAPIITLIEDVGVLFQSLTTLK